MTKILIVDEDTDVLRLLRVKLNAAGYEVSRARDGKEALVQVEKEQPEIIITELLLPDINGLDLLVQLKAEQSTAALILILSSAGSDEEIAAALAAGAADYVSKPFSPQLLLERIRVNRLRAALAAAIGE